jgi:hypothetical protein
LTQEFCSKVMMLKKIRPVKKLLSAALVVSKEGSRGGCRIKESPRGTGGGLMNSLNHVQES